jgi:hypothetical protein
MKPTSVETEQTISGLEGLWRQVLPDFDPPCRSRLRGWLEIGPPATVEYAIRRACRNCWKAAREGRPLNAGKARAYCENVLKNEVEQKQAADGWSAVKEEREAVTQ